jgi:sulfhydrogenase subunit beta (sulfur reductase)
MAAVKVKMKEVPQFLEGARAAGYDVFTPARAPEGWAFAPYESGGVDLDGYLLTTASVKDFALPQLEALLSYDDDGGRPAPTPGGKRLVFGVRPCDARGLALVDRVYRDRGFRDPNYLSRRDNTVLVVLACHQPAPTCFCTSVGGGPADGTGADVIAYEAASALVMEAASPRGEEFLKTLPAAEVPAKEVGRPGSFTATSPRK